MDTQTQLNLNPFYTSNNSPLQKRNYISGYNFDSEYERGAVTTSKVQSINADKINAGTINSTVVYGGTITGNQLSGGTLTLGGTANGDGLMQIKNASGTTIIQGANDGHNYYTDTGIRQIKVDETGLTAYKTDGSTPQFSLSSGGFYGYGTTGGIINFKTSSSGTAFGEIGYGTSSGVGMYLHTPQTLALAADGDVWAIADGKSYITGDNATLYATSTGGTARVYSDNDIEIYAPESGADIRISAGDDVEITVGGDFKINGASKTAIVPTKEGYKALYCIEAPEVWFMDFIGEDKKLDPIFEEATEGDCKYIKTEDGYQVWRKRKGFGKIRFETKTKQQFESNNTFWGEKKIDNSLDKAKVKEMRDLIGKRKQKLT